MDRFRRRRDEEESLLQRRVPLFVTLGALLLYYLRFGYDYANSDQDEVIPYLLHRLDGGLFTQDWFVSSQATEFSVRTYFVWLLNAFSLILPVWLTVLVFHVVTWLLVAGAVYKLTYHFTKDQLAACAAIFLALVFTPVWTLGGNDLVHSMLVASMVGWALGLWAIYHFLRARFLIAPVLLGVACWIQPLVGLHLAMLLFLLRIARFFRDRGAVDSMGGIVVFGMLFVLWASPALGPIAYQQLLEPASHADGGPSLFYILAEFRLPHHYLPGSFYFHNVIRFSALALAAAAAMRWRPYSRQLDDRAFFIRLLALIFGFCVVSWIFTEIVPVLFVAKLQLFKMTVAAKLLFVILISGAFFYWLPQPIRRPLLEIVRRRRTGLFVVLVLWAVAVSLSVAENGILRDRVGPFRRAATPLGEVQEWAHRRTAIDAIFAVPPSISSFRSEAQRTIVINYKAVPYEDELMVTWFERLTDFAPIDLPERGGPDILDQLDAAYEGLGRDRLADLASKYEFDYLVRRTPLPDPKPFFEQAIATDGWIVYGRAELPDSSALHTAVPSQTTLQ